MIVKTRYRDIDLEEARKCDSRLPAETGAKNWNKDYRGQEIEIVTPAYGPPAKPPHAVCDGPFFVVVGRDLSVCPHIAEIGD